MSSYLNIYIPIKKEDGIEERITLIEVSRNNDLYQAFSDYGFCPYGYENAEELTSNKLRNIYASLREELDNTNRSIINLKLYNQGNQDTIAELISTESYANDINDTMQHINILKEILANISEKEYTLKYYID